MRVELIHRGDRFVKFRPDDPPAIVTVNDIIISYTGDGKNGYDPGKDVIMYTRDKGDTVSHNVCLRRNFLRKVDRPIPYSVGHH